MKNTVKQHLNKRYIAPELRVCEEKDEIDLLLEGKIISLDFEELQDIIGNINKLNINTLLIQKSGWLYYVKVDDATVKNYIRKKDIELNITLTNNSTISFEPNTRGLRSKMKCIDIV